MNQQCDVLLLTLLLTLAAPVSASVQPTEYRIPKGSPFELIEPAPPGADLAKFRGSARIAGKFVATWLFDGLEPLEIELTFLPDANSKRLLPYVKDSKLRPAEELSFSNEDQAFELPLTPNELRLLRARTVLTVSGTVTIQIAKYATAADCDHRAYVAKLVRVERHGTVHANMASKPYTGC
ncbi:MAG: hypothetical protein ACHBNF_11080 [Chromatiales bacterium]